MLLFLAVVLGYPEYQDRIPNGRVNGRLGGHGGGVGAFRVAFISAGYRWTRALCEADQDGDGQTNGLELGDPCCVWTPGSTPAYTTDITIAGIASSMTGRTMPDCTAPSVHSPPHPLPSPSPPPPPRFPAPPLSPSLPPAPPYLPSPPHRPPTPSQRSAWSSSDSEGGGCGAGCVGVMAGALGGAVPLLVCLVWLMGAFAPRCPSPLDKPVPPKGKAAIPGDVQVEVESTPSVNVVIARSLSET